MTQDEYNNLQVQRCAANWMKPALIWWRPNCAEDSGAIQHFRQWDEAWPNRCLRSDDNPSLGIPPGKLIDGAKINPSTNHFWTQEELDEIHSVEATQITTLKELNQLDLTDEFEQQRLIDLGQFASEESIDPIPIIEEERRIQLSNPIQSTIIANSKEQTVKQQFVKLKQRQQNNKALLFQLALKRQNHIRNPKFFKVTPKPKLLPIHPQIGRTAPIIPQLATTQDKLTRPFFYLEIEFPDKTIGEVRNDLWELACGRCRLKHTHFLHQKEVFADLYYTLLEFIKQRGLLFEKFSFAMQHNIFGLSPEDDEPQFDQQQTHWKVSIQLRRLCHRLGRLSGEIKSRRGVTTSVADRIVNMDECWVALFENNCFAEPYQKLTDEELLEEMFKLFPHMRSYHQNNPNTYDIIYLRNKYNCGFFDCQGKRRPTNRSHKYRRIPSPHEGYFSVWKCRPHGKIFQNITPSFSSLVAAERFMKEQGLKINIRLDPNRGFQHRKQIGKARFRQIPKPQIQHLIGDQVDNIEDDLIVESTTDPNDIIETGNIPQNPTDSQQQTLKKEVDGTIRYISEIESSDFDIRHRKPSIDEDNLSF